jgi:UDP-N-acetylglucosamine 4,6-dehydratase/5-epimerase
MDFMKNKSVLITGGTGSLGHAITKFLINNCSLKRLVIFSRDEFKQFNMSQTFPESKYPFIRYFIGDVRDKDRVKKAFANIDIVIHAAAMKIVPSAEYNPSECIDTNIGGAQNVIDASISNKVSKVIALSTDKAANPINLYGASKLCSDKLFIAANNLSGKIKTRFSVVRYGNVLGSRGSVLPFFNSLIDKGIETLPITDINMTRFVITIEHGVQVVLNGIKNMVGGEIIVPKLPSFKILSLVEALSKDLKYEIIGIRPGEKLHEIMIPEEESLNCIDMGDYFIIQPMHYWWNNNNLKKIIGNSGKAVSNSFEYSSNKNDQWLNVEDLKYFIKYNKFKKLY